MTTSTDAIGRAAAMTEGRRADTARRHQRVLAALTKAVADGDQITVSGIARRAGVDRTFLYRHRDLLEQLHTLEGQVSSAAGAPIMVTRASLESDLHAAQHRAARPRCPRAAPRTSAVGAVG